MFLSHINVSLPISLLKNKKNERKKERTHVELVWAIGFLVLHGPALAKTRSSLRSLSSHQWSGIRVSPHVSKTNPKPQGSECRECVMWKRPHVAKK